MKVSILFSAAVLAMVAGASSASADVIDGSTGAAWQSFPGTLNNYSNSNRPYWDQKSEDGVNDNVGNYLKTTLGVTPAWWGKTGSYTSNADLNYHFTHSTTSGATTGALKIEIAGNSSTNIVGWYNADNPSEKHVLWSGSASPSNNASVIFTPTADYGFYLIGAEGTYYTDSSLNSYSERGYQHFATFANSLTAGSEKYTIGVEDLDAYHFSTTEKLGDYQDFVFSIQSVPGSGSGVPEPASLSLLALGGAGLLARRRR